MSDSTRPEIRPLGTTMGADVAGGHLPAPDDAGFAVIADPRRTDLGQSLHAAPARRPTRPDL